MKKEVPFEALPYKPSGKCQKIPSNKPHDGNDFYARKTFTGTLTNKTAAKFQRETELSAVLYSPFSLPLLVSKILID